MKIAATSDTHGVEFFDRIPECDVLLIGGDISPVKLPHDYSTQKGWFIKRFIPLLQKLRNEKCGKIVFVAGNHDTFFYECFRSQKEDSEIRSLLPDGVSYLCGSSVDISGVKIYGSPWVNLPSWGNAGPPVWNFATSNEAFLDAEFANIPKDTDIVLSHGPIFGFCDQILDGELLREAFDAYGDRLKAEHLGSKVMCYRLRDLAKEGKAKYFFCGHIHSANHNAEKLFHHEKPENIINVIGVSLLDENYQIGYPPFVFNYTKEEGILWNS